MFSQLFAKMNIVAEGGTSRLNYDVSRDSLRSFKLDLAMSFLKDLDDLEKGASNNRGYSKANIDFLLGSGQTAKVSDKLKSNPNLSSADFDKALMDLSYNANSAADRSILRDRFLDYVFAEGFDSQGCSPETRAVLARDFKKSRPKVESAFNYLAGEFSTGFLKILPPVPLASATQAGTSSSLSLNGYAYPQGTYQTQYLNQGYVPQYPGQVYPAQMVYPQQNTSPLLLALANPAIQAQFGQLLSGMRNFQFSNTTPQQQNNIGPSIPNSNQNPSNLQNIANQLNQGGCPGGCCGGCGGGCSGGNCCPGGVCPASGGCSGCGCS